MYLKNPNHMDSLKIKEHAITSFANAIQFWKYVLKDFPQEKLELEIEGAEAPIYFMKHVSGTASYWMKRISRPFNFQMRCVDTSSFLEKMEKQLEELKEVLNDESLLTWITPHDSPNYSVPWLMVRTANHAMHHAAMIIVYRHYYRLGPLKQGIDLNWGNIVDFHGRVYNS